MKKMIGSFSLAVALGLSLPSCGGDGSMTAASGDISASTMSAMLSSPAFADLLTGMTLQNSGTIGLPFTVPASATGLNEGPLAQGNPFAVCTTKTGSATDGADADGIPKLYSRVYSCTGIVNESGGTSSLTGSITSIDKDDTKYGALGGYKYAYDIKYDDVYSHERNFGAFSGAYEASFVGTTLSLDSSYSVTAGSAPTGHPEQESNWTVSNQSMSIYKVDDATKPWESGTLNMSGFFGLKGTFYEGTSKQQYPLSVVFEIKGKDLVYSRACSRYFKDGQLSFNDAGGNQFVYTYSNCTVSRTFNGKTI